ncbi:hypothetical protein PNOK_0650900 [Pyrrhoderma noxium]|uniref:Uncharacterized protein n=1 Tax=Pyrrhoderma noxium TaxID=2282107 RepID=A0A286UEJ5_9AGAM|nr:hypothetical protein PNOK_0650900 [Pyrrhoderma noxium]
MLSPELLTNEVRNGNLPQLLVRPYSRSDISGFLFITSVEYTIQSMTRENRFFAPTQTEPCAPLPRHLIKRKFSVFWLGCGTFLFSRRFVSALGTVNRGKVVVF